MADTVNQPGIRCHIASSLDSGWCSTEAGFTDDCTIARYWQVFFSQSQSDFRWVWLENPGVLVSSQAPGATPNVWRFFRAIAPIEQVCIIELEPIVPPVGNPQISFRVDIIYNSQITGLIQHEKYTNIFTTSKRGIHNVGACERIFPPSTPCSSLGPIRLQMWPSCDGVPEDGPTWTPDP